MPKQKSRPAPQGNLKQGPRSTGQQGGFDDNRAQGQQGRDVQRDKQSDQQGGGSMQHRAKQETEGRQPGRQEKQKTVHGEGNYAASKQYNDATRDFAQSGRVDEAARAAEPRTDADALQMQAAEAEGKRRAKGEDPALNRKNSRLSPDTPRAPKPGEEE